MINRQYELQVRGHEIFHFTDADLRRHGNMGVRFIKDGVEHSFELDEILAIWVKVPLRKDELST